jgi:transcriptional regulator with GAF, ATPase, and Fis domain
MDETAVRVRYLLRTSTLLQSMREMYGSRATPAGKVFRQHTLALISEIVPADDGAIFLYDSGDEVWPELAEEAINSKQPVFTPAEMAVPLGLRDAVAGAIWLKRTEPFEDQEFELLAAICEIGSLALENAFHLEWLQSEVKRLERDLGIEEELLGDSAAMADLRASVARVAHTDATVLVTGESGTGKELVARAIHRKSSRAGKPFVAINCAALSETLLESELFGHEKGAFTGAFTQKQGKLEAANGGTVFLDEIGEMPLVLQAKLLRVLQHREVERVGGTKSIPLNFRLIAATNRNLEEAVRCGSFRQDLYYRLNVVALRTPPLRKRPEDILPLAQHFMARFGAKCGRKMAGMSPEARTMLRAYEWPGNVRELENAIERAVVLGDTGMVLAEDLPEVLRENPAAAPEGCGSLQDAVNAAKRLAVERAFEQARNNHDEAAHLLGVHPNYLYRLIKNMRIAPTRRASE